MNSSSEQDWPVSNEVAHGSSYPALVYPEENAVLCTPSDHESTEARGDAEVDATNDVCEQCDPTAEFSARLEKERREIKEQAQLEAAQQLQRVRAETLQAVEQFKKQCKEYFKQAETEVVGLALAIAKRLIHREVQMDTQLLSDLVHHELERIDAGTHVRLRVSLESIAYWQNAAASMEQTVEVEADKSLAADELRIETELGSTALSFESELKEIERGLFDLLSRHPASGESISARVQ